MLSHFIRDEEGSTLVEYIVLGGLLSVIGATVVAFVLFVGCMIKFLF